MARAPPPATFELELSARACRQTVFDAKSKPAGEGARATRDLSRSELQPHAGPGKDGWADGQHRSSSDVVTTVGQVLHGDEQFHAMAEFARCGGIEREITPQQKCVLIVVELVPSEATLHCKKHKGRGVARLKGELIARNLGNVEADQTRIQSSQSRVNRETGHGGVGVFVTARKSHRMA